MDDDSGESSRSVKSYPSNPSFGYELMDSDSDEASLVELVNIALNLITDLDDHESTREMVSESIIPMEAKFLQAMEEAREEKLPSKRTIAYLEQSARHLQQTRSLLRQIDRLKDLRVQFRDIFKEYRIDLQSAIILGESREKKFALETEEINEKEKILFDSSLFRVIAKAARLSGYLRKDTYFPIEKTLPHNDVALLKQLRDTNQLSERYGRPLTIDIIEIEQPKNKLTIRIGVHAKKSIADPALEQLTRPKPWHRDHYLGVIIELTKNPNSDRPIEVDIIEPVQQEEVITEQKSTTSSLSTLDTIESIPDTSEDDSSASISLSSGACSSISESEKSTVLGKTVRHRPPTSKSLGSDSGSESESEATSSTGSSKPSDSENSVSCEGQTEIRLGEPKTEETLETSSSTLDHVPEIEDTSVPHRATFLKMFHEMRLHITSKSATNIAEYIKETTEKPTTSRSLQQMRRLTGSDSAANVRATTEEQSSSSSDSESLSPSSEGYSRLIDSEEKPAEGQAEEEEELRCKLDNLQQMAMDEADTDMYTPVDSNRRDMLIFVERSTQLKRDIAVKLKNFEKWRKKADRRECK